MRFTPAQIVVSSMRLYANSLHIGRNINWHTRTMFTQSSIKSCTNLFHIFTEDIGRQVVNNTTCCVEKILSINIMFIFLHQLPTTSCSPADIFTPVQQKYLFKQYVFNYSQDCTSISLIAFLVAALHQKSLSRCKQLNHPVSSENPFDTINRGQTSLLSLMLREF